MDKKMKNSLSSLAKEFRIIQETLQPAIAEMKKIKELEIEFKKFKTDIYSQIKKIDFETRRLKSKKAGKKDTKKIADLEKDIERRLNALTNRLEATKIKDKTDEEELQKVEKGQKDFEKKLKQHVSKLDKKYSEWHKTDREMIASLISEVNYLKKQLEKESRSSEKSANKFDDFERWFRERDKHQTKEMNIRKRHINQVTNELNDARERDHVNATKIDTIRNKQNELKTDFIKINNEMNKLNKQMETRVENVKMDDVLLNFSRLEKKTIADVGEIKGRMRELERKTISRKDVDKLQTDIIEKLKSDVITLNANLNRLNKKFGEVSKSPTTEQFDYMKEVINKLKRNVDTNDDSIKIFRKDLTNMIGKVEEMYSFKEPLKDIKQDIIAVNSKVESKLHSLRSELDRINIKVDNTSRLLKDLDKVL